MRSVPHTASPNGRGVSARLRRLRAAAGDALALIGVVLAIPFVILAIGIPIALFVQLLLWIGRLL
jgi:hypothetical protein